MFSKDIWYRDIALVYGSLQQLTSYFSTSPESGWAVMAGMGMGAASTQLWMWMLLLMGVPALLLVNLSRCELVWVGGEDPPASPAGLAGTKSGWSNQLARDNVTQTKLYNWSVNILVYFRKLIKMSATILLWQERELCWIRDTDSRKKILKYKS